jgi:hypothetical protein
MSGEDTRRAGPGLCRMPRVDRSSRHACGRARRLRAWIGGRRRYHGTVSAPADLAPIAAPVPRRTAICLSCRTALFPGEACDTDSSHGVASLGEARGRELLVEAAWGPPDVRLGEARLALHAEHAVALLSLFGFVAGLLGLWLILPGLGPLHVLGAALSMALFWGGGNLVLARRGSDFPVGARPLLGEGAAGDDDGEETSVPAALTTRGRLGQRGTAAGEAMLESPASGAECLAFAVELHFVGYWGDRVMYRDAVTCGFDVLLTDGRIARVPPGRIRLVAPMRQVIDVDNVALESYLRDVDREHEPGRAFDPLRYNVVAEALLLLGDPVELLSRFEPEVNARAAPTSYREPAPSVWVAQELPILRL